MSLAPYRPRRRWLAMSAAALLVVTAWARAADPFSTLKTTPPVPAAGWAGAQAGASCDRPDAMPWGLSDVVQVALCTNPRTRQTWAAARVQAAQLGAAQSARLPTLDLNTSAARARSGIGGPLETPAQNRLAPTLQLNYLLFDFGGRSGAIEQARQALLAADWTHNATLQTVLLDAIQAYYQLLGAQASLTAAQKAEAAAREAFDAASYRHQIGAAALTDKLQAQTAYAQTVLLRRQAEGTAALARGNLANAVGLDADKRIALAPPPGVTPHPPATDTDLAGLIARARRARPDLTAARARVEAARSAIDSARANGLPSLYASGNYGYSANDPGNNTRSWSAGLTLNVPLFSGFRNTYEIHAAEAQLGVQQASEEQLSQQVSLDVWSAYQRLQTIVAVYESSVTVLNAAEETDRAALGRYRAGAGTILELLNAQSSLANARSQMVQAQYNWYAGRVVLAQALGTLDYSAIDRIETDGTPEQ